MLFDRADQQATPLKSDSQQMNAAISINKYMPIAIVYFFFNGFLLPLGLLYTTLLSPLFLIWLYKYPSFSHLKWFFVCTVPFVLLHLIQGVDLVFYLRSYLLFFSVYIFALAFYQFLKVCKSLTFIFRTLAWTNFGLTIVAIVFFFIPAVHDLLWTGSKISSGIEGVERLKLLTYEPSYYSTLLAPIALYYYLKIILNKVQNPILTLVVISIPLLLSFSFGVILAIIIALCLLLLFNINSFFRKRIISIYIIVGILALVISLVTFFVLFPDNVFLQRLSNVLEGRDTSFKGRTYDAYYLGWKIAEMKSIFWGSGLGQVKVLGLELWQKFYAATFTQNKIAIPNAVGETLAVFGIIGVCIRFALEVFFFFKCRVYQNFYQLLLFLFIFFYQFTGSYIFNIAEYVIWILSFSRVFPELDKNRNPPKRLA